MGIERQMAAHLGDVGGMDEVEAGIGPEAAGKPEVAAGVTQPGREIAGGEGAGPIHAAAEHQRGENRHTAVGQGVLLELPQTDGLGLDVFGAVGLRLV